MCNCDCELTKGERWARIREEHAHHLADQIRSLRDMCQYPEDSVEYRHMSSSAAYIDPWLLGVPKCPPGVHSLFDPCPGNCGDDVD